MVNEVGKTGDNHPSCAGRDSKPSGSHKCAFSSIMAEQLFPVKDILLKEMRISTYSLLQNYEERRFDYVIEDPVTMNICSILEAIFLHGLYQKSQSLFVTHQSQTVEEMSFSSFLKAFVPKNLLHTLDNRFIRRTNIGRCRIWIRACLNEASLHSYLVLCSSERGKLSQLYSPDAVIMQPDFLRQIVALVELLEELRFRLDLTSPLLNSWSNSDALWFLGFRSEKKNTLISSPTTSTKSHPKFYVSTDSTFEESVLDAMLAFDPSNDYEAYGSEFGMRCGAFLCGEQRPETHNTFLPSWDQSDSSPLSVNENTTTDIVNAKSESAGSKIGDEMRPRKRRNAKLSKRSRSASRSQTGFFALDTQLPSGSNNLLSYRWRGVHQSDSSDSDSFADMLDTKSAHASSHQSTPMPVSEWNMTAEADSSFQIVGEDLLVALTDQDVERLGRLYPGAASFDLDNDRNCAFHGQCNRCGRFLSPKTSFIDTYDARLYCTNCHQLQETVVPRDVVFNWDFSLHSVSQTTKSFLSGLYYKPVLNLAKLNPTLYAVIPELLSIRQLRRALILLWHQISRCDAKVASDLRRSLKPRDYMLFSLNDLDVYSMHDLVEVHSGRLERKITSVLHDIALAHVHGCLACRHRALLCDLCEDLRSPIWPHEVTTYRRCSVPGCHHVMHVSCLADTLQHSTTQTGCFGCRTATGSPGLLNQFNPLVQRCRLCKTYAQTLDEHGVGHYADPFIETVTTTIYCSDPRYSFGLTKSSSLCHPDRRICRRSTSWFRTT